MFVFYDTETTGISRHFDQVLQFAAIATDDELNELGRFEVRSRLMPHVLPSPVALRVTRMAIEDITCKSRPTHYEMMCAVQEQLTAWSPAVFAGWNTLGFDEHLLRQALYQCLHSPYLTSRKGCARFDALKLARCLALTCPNALNIPTDERGKPSYKLDRLAPANGFNHFNAHDALADVEATIHIARLMRERARECWDNAIRLCNKDAAAAFVSSEALFVLTEAFYGRVTPYVVAPLGAEAGNPNSILAWDLAVDPHQAADCDDEVLTELLTGKSKPLRRLKLNEAPQISAFDAGRQHAGLTGGELVRRAELLASNHDLRARIVSAVPQVSFPAAEHVEQQIYDAFPCAADERLMREFHRVSWEQRLQIAERFQDGRLRTLGRRLVYLHCPESMSAEECAEHARWIASRLDGTAGVSECLSLSDADEHVTKLLASCSDDERAIYSGYQTYVADRLASVGTLPTAA